MSKIDERIAALEDKHKSKSIQVKTLGKFELVQNENVVKAKSWGRDKTIQLFQYFISNRKKKAQHKEQIIDRIWDDVSDRDFKVALHGINKVLEPERAPRTDPKFIIRNGTSYYLDVNEIGLDINLLEEYVVLANSIMNEQPDAAIELYQKAIELYDGAYLPDRIYEDWTSEEREHTLVLVLGAYATLAELLCESKPMESVRLTQEALRLDPTWEDLYRIQMKAYLQSGNRIQAIKTYKKCEKLLLDEYDIEPLPNTKALFDSIK